MKLSEMINIAKMLPIPPGGSFSEWASEWCVSISREMQSQLEDDLVAIRRRNEKFSAYLPTLSLTAAKFQEKIDEVEDAYKREHKRPSTGITLWREAMDDETRKYRRQRDLLLQLHKDISTRLSNGQSSMKSLNDNINHGTQ